MARCSFFNRRNLISVANFIHYYKSQNRIKGAKMHLAYLK